MMGRKMESLEDGIADDTAPAPTGPVAIFFFSGPSSRSTPFASLFLRESRFVLFPLVAPPPRLAAFTPLLAMLADASVIGWLDSTAVSAVFVMDGAGELVAVVGEFVEAAPAAVGG